MDGASQPAPGRESAVGWTHQGESWGSMHTIPGALRGLPRLTADGSRPTMSATRPHASACMGRITAGECGSSQSRVAKAAMQSAPTFKLWALIATHQDDALVRVPPFDAISSR